MSREDESRTEEAEREPALVPTMKRFAEDFSTMPWGYFFDTNASFVADVQALLRAAS